jgi:hypothetical protein
MCQRILTNIPNIKFHENASGGFAPDQRCTSCGPPPFPKGSMEPLGPSDSHERQPCINSIGDRQMYQYKVQVKQSNYRPLRFQEVEAPRFLNNQHMKVVRLSALRTGRLYLQEISLVLISVRGWVDPRAILRPKRLCQWKFQWQHRESNPRRSNL